MKEYEATLQKSEKGNSMKDEGITEKSETVSGTEEKPKIITDKSEEDKTLNYKLL